MSFLHVRLLCEIIILYRLTIFFFFSLFNSCAPGYDQRGFTGLDSLSVWAPISDAWGEFDISKMHQHPRRLPLSSFYPPSKKSESVRCSVCRCEMMMRRGNSAWCIIHLPPQPFWLESWNDFSAAAADADGGRRQHQLNRFASSTWKIHHVVCFGGDFDWIFFPHPPFPKQTENRLSTFVDTLLAPPPFVISSSFARFSRFQHEASLDASARPNISVCFLCYGFPPIRPTRRSMQFVSPWRNKSLFLFSLFEEKGGETNPVFVSPWEQDWNIVRPPSVSRLGLPIFVLVRCSVTSLTRELFSGFGYFLTNMVSTLSRAHLDW